MPDVRKMSNDSLLQDVRSYLYVHSGALISYFDEISRRFGIMEALCEAEVAYMDGDMSNESAAKILWDRLVCALDAYREMKEERNAK